MKRKTIKENHFFFTSESVTEGHPDKMCDIISDSILDECLKTDPYARVACETLIKSNFILIAGEITTSAKPELELIIREAVKEIGYDSIEKGLDYKNCDVMIKITKQSPNIEQAIDHLSQELEIGAGDQGNMFGYATDETIEKMPFSHIIALQLSAKLTEVRKTGKMEYLYPCGKAQVTVEYQKIKNKIIPLRIESICIMIRYDPIVKLEILRYDINEHVIRAIIPPNFIDKETNIFINPDGKNLFGGPESQVGLTGRKIIVDSYGGWGTHGGGAFSGKDVTKVDRSAAYAARWIAKSLVCAGLCSRVLVQISYSIGLSDPLSIYVDTYGSVIAGKTDRDLYDIIIDNFNLKPGFIIRDLNLRRPIFKMTACYGHFGRNIEEFTWEKEKELKI